MPSEAGLAEALDFGDVVLVPFPYTDQTGSKRRPAVVISRRAYNLARPDAVLMSITSQLRPMPRLGDVELTAWAAAGLLKPSIVKPVISTFEHGLVIRRLGTLGDDDLTGLRHALLEMFG